MRRGQDAPPACLHNLKTAWGGNPSQNGYADANFSPKWHGSLTSRQGYYPNPTSAWRGPACGNATLQITLLRKLSRQHPKATQERQLSKLFEFPSLGRPCAPLKQGSSSPSRTRALFIGAFALDPCTLGMGTLERKSVLVPN